MRGVVMAVDGVLILVRLRGAILMMAECHALPCRDRRHALDRDGEGQQKDRKKSEESFRHRHAFYVNCLERGPPRRFPLNAAIIGVSIAALVACWVLIRQQGAVGDRQFLRSMIPHHSGAILMCGKAPLRDAEIQRLCKTIIAGQADEIRQMEDKLAALSQ